MVRFCTRALALIALALSLDACGSDEVTKKLNDDPLPGAFDAARALSAAVDTSQADTAAADPQAITPAGTCVASTSGRTLFQPVTVPAFGSITCSTVGATTLDTVLLLMRNPDFTTNRHPCASPYTAQIQWNVAAFNDNASGTKQSRVSWPNPDGVARSLFLVGFLASGTSVGTANVTCRLNNGSTTVYAGAFTSKACTGMPTSPTIYTTSGGADTTLLAIVDSFTNQNHQSNDDCATGETPSPESCLRNMTTWMKTWFVDLGCFGQIPRNATVHF